MKSETQDQIAMVSLNGAPGDHLSALPALRQFGKQYAALFMSAYWRGGLVKAVYENTGIVDRFVWLDPDKMKGWTEAQISESMLRQLDGHDFDHYYDLNGYHGMMTTPEEWNQTSIEPMRKYHNRHKIYDRYCDVLKVPMAKGKRPRMKFSDDEISWLQNFQEELPLLKLVGWQWSGSSKVKEFPAGRTFDLLSTFLEKYSDVHILTMGSERFSNARIPERRCDNLAGKISWRQAALLTSILDLYIAPDTSIMVAAQGFRNVPKILLATTTSGKAIAFSETQIIQSTADCSPCYRVLDTCNMDDCCGKIDSTAILTAADKILRS